MAYAHAVIDAPDGTRYERGDEVDLDKFPVIVDKETGEEIDQAANLYEGGALSDEEYDEAVDKVGPPDVIVIEGVEYVKAADGAKEDTDAVAG